MTVEVDEELVENARSYTGLEDATEVVAAVMRKWVQGEAARRLARLGGSEPDAQYIPRRRSAK